MSKVERLITKHLDIWSSTVKTKSSVGRGTSKKIELYGINKLRELILDLAVRGLLAPQDPDDEPASELLKKIKKEKDKLVKEGKIKKQKKLPPITDSEKPYTLPENWEWARLNDVYDIRDGTHDTPKYVEKGYPLVTSKNLSSGQLDLTNVKYISKADYKKIIERSLVVRDDILFAMIGSIGNPVIVNVDQEFGIKNVALFKYYSTDLSCPRFLLKFLLFAEISLKANASGAVQSFISLGKLRAFVMPLPPINEQHRIATKVDELMVLCDELEKAQEESIDAHEVLVKELLSTLTDAAKRENFDKAWERISNNFDILFTTESSIKELKKTILQLAVMGKLVPQDPDDEPASELLNKVTREKDKLVKEGKIKKQKKLSPVTDQEKPYTLPENWKWVRFGDIAQHNAGKTLDKGRNKGTPRQYLTTSNLYWGRFEINSDKKILIEEHELEKCSASKGDLLICEGGDAGRAAVWSYDYSMCFQNHIHRARFFAKINPFYAYRYLEKLSMTGEIEQYRKGVGITNMSGKSLSSIVFALPSLKMQKAIVSKVDELMKLCDKLEEKISSSQQTQVLISDTLIQDIRL